MKNGCFNYFLKYKKNVYRERKNISSSSDFFFIVFNSLPDSPELNATTMGVDSDSEPELAEQAEHENTNKSKVKQRQFITVDEESLDNFITEQENKSTAKKNTV